MKYRFLKSIHTALLFSTIILISVEKSVLLFISTYYYSLTHVPWYEWSNYIILGLGTAVLPILSFFYLDNIYIRRLLRWYLFGVIFTNIFTFIEDVVSNIGTIWQYERPLNAILIFIETISAMYCWLILLRQIKGKSLLPIEITTPYLALESRTFTKFIKIASKNLVDFIKKEKIHKKNLLIVTLLINLVIFSSLTLSFLLENTTIVLNRPEDHSMQISFWLGDSRKLDNSSLDILSAKSVKIYAWGDYKDVEWIRYGDRGIEVIIVKEFEENETQRDEDFQEIADVIDYLDSHPELPIVGFADDMEKLAGISRYNSSWLDSYENYIQNKTNYVHSRGYEYHITQWLVGINDLRDGDSDMAIVYKNPFDPIKFENLTSIGWMIYRSEIAIIFDEPYEYFTYHWASQVNNYMDFIESEYHLAQGSWKNKSTISIGVTKNSDSLFTFNTELNPNAKFEWFQEMKICHAMEINEVIIFIAGRLNQTDEFFGLVGGNLGLQEMFDELDSYETVSFQYKKRATFFGNLKLLSNITGSVIGLFYSDLYYDNWVGYLCFFWVALFLVFTYYFVRHNPTEKIEKKEFKRSSEKMIALKISTLVVIVSTFFLTGIFFWYKPFFTVLRNIKLFL